MAVVAGKVFDLMVRLTDRLFGLVDSSAHLIANALVWSRQMWVGETKKSKTFIPMFQFIYLFILLYHYLINCQFVENIEGLFEKMGIKMSLAVQKSCCANYEHTTQNEYWISAKEKRAMAIGIFNKMLTSSGKVGKCRNKIKHLDCVQSKI